MRSRRPTRHRNFLGDRAPPLEVDVDFSWGRSAVGGWAMMLYWQGLQAVHCSGGCVGGLISDLPRLNEQSGSQGRSQAARSETLCIGMYEI